MTTSRGSIRYEPNLVASGYNYVLELKTQSSFHCGLHNLSYCGITKPRNNWKQLMLVVHLKRGVYKSLEFIFTQKEFLKQRHEVIRIARLYTHYSLEMRLPALWISQYTAARILVKENTAVPWFVCLLAGLSPRRSRLHPSPDQVGSVVDNVTMEQSLHRLLRFSPVQFHSTGAPLSFLHLPLTMYNLDSWRRR